MCACHDTLNPGRNPITRFTPRMIAIPAMFAPMFRVIEAQRFLETFASDRSHMRSEEGWQRPPPEWPCIGTGMNLMRFVDMEAEFEGRVVELPALVRTLTTHDV